MPTPKPAAIIAVAVAVLCPACGEDQPEPDHGSLRWDMSQLTHYAGPRTCTTCGAAYVVKAKRPAV